GPPTVTIPSSRYCKCQVQWLLMCGVGITFGTVKCGCACRSDAMIMRVLRAKVKAGKLKEYQRLCEERSVPHLRATPGLVALHMGAPLLAQPDEFVIVTVWHDLAALVGFAGEQWREVVILPGEAELVDEMVVEHYDESLRTLGEVWRVNS